MNLRTFYRQCELELIPAGLETLTLGKCVWDGGWFDQPSFVHEEMPNYIYNIFVEKNLITDYECETQLERLHSLKNVEAAFAKESIEFEVEDALEIKIAKQINMNANFDLKSVKSFSISGAVGKAIPNRDRINIDRLLDQVKDKHWEEYKSKLRRVYIVTELFYGKVEITIDNDLEINFETALPFDQLQTVNKYKLGKNVSYIFESSKVPFAMRLERIKQFNS
jgi:hypothetical protein